jgi:hypothetical protein
MSNRAREGNVQAVSKSSPLSSPKSWMILSIASSESSLRRSARRSSSKSGSWSCRNDSGITQFLVKSRRDCFNANFSIWRASIRTGLMRFRFFVSVSLLDEKMCLEGTADACIGRKSRDTSKKVGCVNSLSCCTGYEYISKVLWTS